MLFNNNQSFEQKRFIHSLLLPMALVFVMLILKFIESIFNVSFANYGILPHTVPGLKGVVFAPFIHGDWGHLWGNIMPFIVLTSSLLFFYRGVAYRTFWTIWFISGIIVWFIGRDSLHIGASGVIYGIAAFLFLSGIIRNYIPLMAISFIVIFLYGSMIWGIWPFHEKLPYSWEAHLGGTLGGILMAIVFRKNGPQKPKVLWEDEEEDDET